MKRTITIRVECDTEEEYADTVAAIANLPHVLAWCGTQISKQVKMRLDTHGVDAVRTAGGTGPWIKTNT